MSAQLFELNTLVKNEFEFWFNPSQSTDFDYSDGSDEEQYLVDLLNNTTDLSVNSPELAAAIQDWPSEYHLSSLRANLFKNLNLTKNSTILEVGCGCGAITRYLGEQGHFVHAVEGSFERAKIARLRNRDLDNVEIICHNFNTLKTEQNYDVVLFTGVLEYAKRFIGKDDLTAEQAVIKLLKRAGSVLKPDGHIIIAIENRTGLKYEKGALEDHLAKPYVGLENYQDYEFTGIKTYDYSQWQEILSEANLKNKFYYPFPDYKLPSLIISNELDSHDANYLSTQIHSYDPISNWTMPQPEHKQWLEIFEQGQLKEKANSFGIIASKSDKALASIFNNDWCLYDSSGIKSTHTIELRKQKRYKDNKNNNIKRLFNEKDDSTDSLESVWLENFDTSPSLETLVKLSEELYQLIHKDWPNNQLIDSNQAMLSEDQSTLQYGKYWQLEVEVSVEQQFFHLLLGFYCNAMKSLSRAVDLNFVSMEQIISTCFKQVGLNYSSLRSNLIGFERSFNNETQLHSKSIEQILATLISSYDQFNFDFIDTQLFFTREANIFSAEHSKTLRQKQTGRLTTLLFENLDATCLFLRLDPCDHQHGNQHYFTVNNIQLTNDKDGLLGSISANNCDHLHQLDIVDNKKAIYKVNGIDPQVIFSLPADLKNTTASYNLAIQLQWLGI